VFTTLAYCDVVMFDCYYSEITLRSATSLQSYVLQTAPYSYYGAYCKIVYSSQPSAAFTASNTFRTTLSTPSLFSRYTGTQPMRR
jgi:galactose-1-phosphate uridylyltransferase